MNKNMRKRKNALILTIVFGLTLISPIFGEDTQTQEINLRNFEETILVTDISITRAKKVVAMAQVSLRQAEDNVGEEGSSDLETKKNKEYYVKEAEIDLAYQYYLLDQTEKSVVLDGKNNYYNYLLKLQEIKLENDKLTRLKSDLAAIEKKIALGLTVASAKSTQELLINKQDFALNSLEYERQMLALDLNQSLLWDLDTTIEIFNMDIPVATLVKPDRLALIAIALENQGEIIQITDSIELAELYLDLLYDEDYEDGDDEVIDAKDSIESLKTDLLEKKLSVEYDIVSAYNSYLNSNDQLKIQALELENLKIQRDIIKKRYDVGFEILATVKASDESIAFSELAYKKALLDNYINVETFKNLTTFDN